MNKREIILIFGKTGSGKSELAKSLLKNYDRKIIIDPMFEYSGGIIFYNVESLIRWYNNNLDLQSKFTFICRFSQDEDFEGLFESIMIIKNLCLVLEEAEIYVSPYCKSSNFLKLVRYGRHSQISIIGIARRTSELSLDFRSQVNKIYSFLQTEPKDVEKMETLGIVGTDKLGQYEKIEKEF